MNRKLWTTALLLIFFLVADAKQGPVPVFESPTKVRNLGALDWKLWCYTPEGWRNNFDFANFKGSFAELRNIPASVPGSVQKALKDAKIIPDWNYELNHRKSEWITNRSWIYVTKIPNDWIEKDKKFRINFKGLDGNGTVLVNGAEVGTFNNAFIPYTFEAGAQLKEKDNTLAVVFSTPPTYLGQVYWTSKVKDWKPRFNYGWDWMPRIVQIGIWDDVLFETYSAGEMKIGVLDVRTSASATKDIGRVSLRVDANRAALKEGLVRVTLKDPSGKMLINQEVPITTLQQEGKVWNDLKIKRWWTNGDGQQPLYDFECSLSDGSGIVQQLFNRKIGFKNIQWLPNKNANKNADPWLCSINNKPIFLQGVNWTPILPNFADLKREHYVKLLKTYKELGINIIRIWGGGYPEHDWLYELCDELGFLIQQDFPLSSSGLDNYPPTTSNEIKIIGDIATHYIERTRHHVSLLMWCGGNELYEMGDGAIVTKDHPLIKNLYNIATALDPERRFVVGSPSGSNIWVGWGNSTTGENWDVHGPWGLPLTAEDRSMEPVKKFWNEAHALMFSEVGVPGAMDAAALKKYAGNMPVLPANYDNALWNRFAWWIEWDDYLAHIKNSGEQMSVENYAAWSQKRQAEGYAIAMGTIRKKFPEVGGMLIWMGHDSYPCFTNNSIIDFDGNVKPAGFALQKIWRNQ